MCKLRLRPERPCGGRCPAARGCAEGAAVAGVRGGSNLESNAEGQFLYPCMSPLPYTATAMLFLRLAGVQSQIKCSQEPGTRDVQTY